MAREKLDERTVAEIRKLRRNGLTCKAITSKLELKKSAVNYWVYVKGKKKPKMVVSKAMDLSTLVVATLKQAKEHIRLEKLSRAEALLLLALSYLEGG